jgi:nucleotide-binding universal stress UspA family protein
MSAASPRILVPVDFSPHSDRAVIYAESLAAQLNASIELLHVLEDPFLGEAWSPELGIPDVTEILATLLADAEGRLAMARTGVRAQGIPAGSVVRRGSPAQTILEHAKACRFDLIVMGTHGRTGLSHALLGSVAERVVRQAPCPVLTLTWASTSAHQDSTIAATERSRRREDLISS